LELLDLRVQPRVHTVVNRTSMVQSANFFELLDRDRRFVGLFNRVFHNFCVELFRS
jgi:hypothetical protein